jgi:hypothetical protein
MPTPTYTSLATTTLGSSAASVTFGSIPGTYRDLIFVVAGSLVSASATDCILRINSDSGSNYSRQFFFAGNNNAVSAGAESRTSYAFWFATDGQANAIGQIMDYSATDKHKTLLSRQNGTQFGVGVSMQAQRWANTAAITNLAFSTSNNFATGTTFSLYGVIA